ncbi:TOMM precursor leader peptide-binding protein [Streptomyces scopuliridis]|uniref:TOMM leader peptide-binding protein n=1 Tax=Streptomyces scopuliridis TaxID=452529 RepID=A0ACD4ZWJ4_9ACTN|nr:TOMM precursor leader peptide-binding protein [Streptomyces scopuliridis]WSC02590.1 TOMM precursor leader peptide-binding protein [Streptomyces scopuliridis]WSC03878.1 TOMM precursor leader peptide-binding protein [Streptomyces scopuliridis]
MGLSTLDVGPAEDLLRRALGRLGGPEVSIGALGTHDAFATEQDAAGREATGRETTGTDATACPDASVPVRLYGAHAVIGPLPGADGAPAPACSHCLARRWQAVRSVALRDALELGGETRAAGEWPYATPFAVDAVAALVTALRERPPAPGGPFPEIRLVDLRTLTVRHYPLVPDPECPRCATPCTDTAEDAAITLRPAPKHRPGSFRLRPIEAYDIDVAAFANPVCGALGPSVVHDVSSTSTSATIGCFSMRSGEYLRETFWGGHADSFGHSNRIGVLEGMERYAGMRARSRITSVTGTLDEFGATAVDPREVGLYAPDFYRANPRVRPFASDREIPWVWGYSLRDEQPRLVPEVLTYYHAPGLENRFVQESSNGCASGGCLEEAIYFGLMEVIERDAFLLAWYGQQPLPEIDPATSIRASTRHMVDRLAMYGYRARFFDTRITFPVPVVTAVAERFDGGPGRMCFGAGAGLDPESALDSALCEIATDAVNLQDRTERDGPRLRAMAADFDRVTALHDHPLVYGVPEMGEHAGFLLDPDSPARRGIAPEPPCAVHELRWPDPSGAMAAEDLREDLRRCVDAVTGAGFDVVVVDQTMPEQRTLGLHTVSVLVPGLLPIDFGWSRQRARTMPRLRTALRTAGLRDHDLGPDDINPAPHPFP